MCEQYENIPLWIVQVSETISLSGVPGATRWAHDIGIFVDTRDECSTTIVHGWKDATGRHRSFVAARAKHLFHDEEVARAVSKANSLVAELENEGCRITGKKTQFHNYPVHRSIEKLGRHNDALLSVPATDLGKVAF